MIPKFRAWDEDSQKMNGNVEIYIAKDKTIEVRPKDDKTIVMQSTGLFDKNGNEIFEGDIVKYKIGWNTFIEEVAYDKNFAGFGVMDAYADSIFSFGKLAEGIDLNSLEVVGNIYENPELLEEK